MAGGRSAHERAPAQICIALALGALAAAVLWPALGNEFVNWDDDQLLTENREFRGLSARHLRWMWTTRLMGHWHPLTWMSYGVDHAAWGLDSYGYHLTNVALHAITAALVYALTRALLARASPAWSGATPAARSIAAGAAALLFALHPLRVESVAWATERRDVLSGPFLVATVLVWLRAADPDAAAAARRRAYAAALVLYALSLLSKAWGITLPVVLLVLDAWPLRRFGRERLGALLLEKLPFALLASGAAAMAIGAQESAGALLEYTGAHTFGERLVQSVYGLCFYVGVTLWPGAPSPLYLLPDRIDALRMPFAGALLAAPAAAVALVLLRRRWPAGLTAFLAYAILVSPVLGLAQSGPQLVASRYAYVACLPLAFLAGALVLALARRSALAAIGLSALVLTPLALLARAEIGTWRDSETLWTRAIEADPPNWFAHFKRGSARQDRGQAPLARADFDRCLELRPSYHFALSRRGRARRELGDPAGARADLDRAIELAPGFAHAWNNRGGLRAEGGDLRGALEDLERAIELDRDWAEPWANRGGVQLGLGDFADAAASLDRAIELDPRLPIAHYTRGQARERLGQAAAAIGDYERALALAPPAWPVRPRVEARLAALRAVVPGN